MFSAGKMPFASTPLYLRYCLILMQNVTEMKEKMMLDREKQLQSMSKLEDLHREESCRLDLALSARKLYEEIVVFISEKGKLLPTKLRHEESSCIFEVLEYFPSQNEAGTSLGHFAKRPLDLPAFQFETDIGRPNHSDASSLLEPWAKQPSGATILENQRATVPPTLPLGQTDSHNRTCCPSQHEVTDDIEEASGEGISEADKVQEVKVSGAFSRLGDIAGSGRARDWGHRPSGNNSPNCLRASPISLSPSMSLGSLSLSEPRSDSPVSFLSEWEPMSLQSLGSLNLCGPEEGINYKVFHLPPGFPYVADICYHAKGVCVCTTSRDGLLFSPSPREESWKKVKESWSSRICARYRGEAAFTVSGWRGNPWVKKYDLGTGTPVEVGSGGYFEVVGGQCLTGIAVSPADLLAIVDDTVKRITVHEPTGTRLYELKGHFEGGQPIIAAWLSEDLLVVHVWGGTLYKRRIVCLRVPDNECVWRSEEIPGAGFVSCWNDRVYVSVVGSTTFKVLSGASGKELPEALSCEKGSKSGRVMDIDGVLTVVSYKRNKQ